MSNFYDFSEISQRLHEAIDKNSKEHFKKLCVFYLSDHDYPIYLNFDIVIRIIKLRKIDWFNNTYFTIQEMVNVLASKNDHVHKEIKKLSVDDMKYLVLTIGSQHFLSYNEQNEELDEKLYRIIELMENAEIHRYAYEQFGEYFSYVRISVEPTIVEYYQLTSAINYIFACNDSELLIENMMQHMVQPRNFTDNLKDCYFGSELVITSVKQLICYFRDQPNLSIRIFAYLMKTPSFKFYSDEFYKYLHKDQYEILLLIFPWCEKFFGNALFYMVGRKNFMKYQAFLVRLKIPKIKLRYKKMYRFHPY